MSSEEEENVEIIENGELNESDPVFRTVAEADVSLDEMMSLACRQGKLDIVELLLESGAHVDYRNKAGNTPLLEACSQGHVDVARYLLDHQANINAPTETTSDSALTWACTLGNEAIVELLLSKNADVEHRTKDGCTALMFAALAGHVKVAAMLLDHGAEINVESDSNKDSPLTFACWKGHCDVVELLLERAANIEHRTKEGFTPLMFAALGGHTDVAAKLLERGAKVNVPSGSNNDIPLTSACWKGHHDVVKLLLEYSSNIEHRTKDGCTPLMLAAREGHYSVAKLILDSKAEVNVPSGSENNIPLTLACWKGHTRVVELLLDHKSNIEHRNKAGCTPLMLAAREGHIDTTKLLLSRGAEINKPSGSNDDTPLTLACWKGHKEVVEHLLKHNSKVDHQTKTGCTPLMEATREGHVAVAEKLIVHGADVELPDNYGQSPLFMACWKGHRDVAELLLENSANRDCRTKTGITPLFQACRENHVDVVELLLDCGASVNAPFPNSRENPLTLAAEKGHSELVSLLLERGANVECHTKKGCTPFNLSCKEGHLAIAIALFKKGADTEACDSRNNTPLVAGMKNGHVEVCEWLLTVVNHLPSEEQAQKCLVAPVEEKEKHDDIMLGRTKCYDIVTKTKKAREQKAHIATEIFLKELEHEKEREENRKKKAAAKRRDKRRKKKAAKESEQQANTNVTEELPSENRPQELIDQDSDQEAVEGSGPETDRSSTQTSMLDSRDTQTPNENISSEADSSPDANCDGVAVHQLCYHIRKPKMSSEVLLGRVHLTRAKRQLELHGDKSRGKTVKYEEKSHIRGAAFAEPDRECNSAKDQTLDKKNSVTSSQNKEKRKSGNFQGKQLKQDQENREKVEKSEMDTKVVTEKNGIKFLSDCQPQTVNSIWIDGKSENQGNKKERSSTDNTDPVRKTTSGKHDANSFIITPKENSIKEQIVNEKEKENRSAQASHVHVKTDKEKSHTRNVTSHVVTTHPLATAATTTTSVLTPTGVSTPDSRVANSGLSTVGQTPIGNKMAPANSDREQKHAPIHSPRSKSHPHNLLKAEDNWKEVTRTTNNKTMVIQLVAPNSLCGRVIGRGGSKINSITEESGAQITIGKPETKGIGDRTITIKGSTKSVQRAKFLVTQALNTPSTTAQSPVSTSTTTVAIANSEPSAIVTSSAAHVTSTFAAITSATSEWPTIMQANKSLHSQTTPKSLHSQTTPKSLTKSSVVADEGLKKPQVDSKELPIKIPELPKPGSTEHLLANGCSNITPTPNVPTTGVPRASVGTAQTTTVWSSKSAWKPYRPTTQSVGVCTSAVKTCTSSSATTNAISTPQSTSLSIHQQNSKENIPTPSGLVTVCSGVTSAVEVRPSYSGIIRGPDLVVSPLQKDLPLPKLSNAVRPPVTTMASTTSAVSTVDHRRPTTIAASEPTCGIVSSADFGVIGGNKRQEAESVSLSSSLPANTFGVIGDGASNVTSFQEPRLECRSEPSLSSTPPTQLKNAALPSPKERSKTKYPCYSPWATQPAGIPDIGGNDFSAGSKYQGSLPGMELFPESNSLFSGPLTSYPWSSGDDSDHLDKSRSFSWSEQTSYPDDQAVPQSLPQSSLPQNDLSPAAQKVSSDAGAAHSSELHGDAAAFKPLSSGSIWSPVGSQSLSTTLTVVCDEEHCDKQGWNNSDSTSSSRSSSRQELSSIMDSENAAGTNVWNSSAFAEDLTPTPQEHSMEFDPSLRGQGLSSVTHWGSNRGAFSAPSSPSLQRTQPNPEVVPPGQPAVDDIAVRTWPTKQKSPRSVSLSDQPLSWNTGPQGHQRTNSDNGQAGVSESSIPSHPWPYSQSQVQPPTQHPYPPGLIPGGRDTWRDTASPSSSSQRLSSGGIDLAQTLQRLGLEKYLHVFQENSISWDHVTQLTEGDLENLGLPKGPRLKLLFAIHGSRWSSGNTFPRPNSGFVNQSEPAASAAPVKKPKSDPVLTGHNHVLPTHHKTHLSPSGRKKHISNHSVQQLAPGVHGNQSLLTQLPSGRVFHPSARVSSLNHEQQVSNLPPRPRSASGNLVSPGQEFVSVSVGSHGDQVLPYMATANHMPFAQPQAPVYYTGAGYYYYYPQQ